MKSNLKRPLKFLIRLFSSFLPRTAIDVASLSKYSFAVIAVAFEKHFRISWIHVKHIVPAGRQLPQEIGDDSQDSAAETVKAGIVT